MPVYRKPNIIYAAGAMIISKGRKCVLCHSRLPPEHRRFRFLLCGPGGTYCESFLDDNDLLQQKGREVYEAVRKLGKLTLHTDRMVAYSSRPQGEMATPTASTNGS